MIKIRNLIILVVVVILALGGWYFYRQNYRASTTTATKTTTNQSGIAVTGTNQVVAKNFAFEPQTITVKKGTTVTWTNQDSVPHEITSQPENMFKSKALGQGESFSFTFNQTGRFDYICSIHPNMKGTVVVE